MSDFEEDDTAVLPDTQEMRHQMVQIASGLCAEFRRGFNGTGEVERLAARGEPHWILDLLSLWRPAGQASGQDGLRLAVRNGYLNFYRRGQSVARVEFVRGQLRGHVHSKYFSAAARERGGQVYGEFAGDHVKSLYEQVRYDGLDTLLAWIALIDTKYAGVEKRLVDDLVGLNSHVIDLEMGLPGWRHRKAPLRMDIVTIDDGQVVFWEAKCAGDARIRAQADPEVLIQLAHYREFLVQDVHRWRIAQAYREAAAVLTRLRAVADAVETRRPLGQAILDARHNEQLTVAREAALVVIDEAAVEVGAPQGRKWHTWHQNGHLAKLKGRARVLAQATPGILRLDAAV
ncbi:hypothetical protein [Phenylobacterium sp.]|jgi:hypothetical protein|uniref:hypothetical protein n=1 Tax=Phenylobacterium sp. TaxID=1871053 RepID=UPI002F93B6CF